MMNALTYSKNCATAYIMKQVGAKRFSQFMQQLNIPTLIEALPSTCLGTSDLSMFEMLWGYTIFANRGISTQPIYLTRIEDKTGKVLETFQPKVKQAISEPSAYLMTRLLKGPVENGTAAGLRASIGVKEMGGKTGTTNDNTDAWFIGFTPKLLAGTWAGCDDRFIRLETKMGMGGTAAKPIWEHFFKKVYADKTLGLNKADTFHRPATIIEKDWTKQPVELDTLAPPGLTDAKDDDAANPYAIDTNTTPIPTPTPIRKPTDTLVPIKKKQDSSKVVKG
jgi:penicillin-binding protein 1A